jgi:hypothetical protein
MREGRSNFLPPLVFSQLFSPMSTTATTTTEETNSNIPPIVSFEDWWKWNGSRAADNSEPVHRRLLDLRNLSEQDGETERLLSIPFLFVDSGHGSVTVVNIPFHDLPERSFELPPRQLAFGLLFDCSDAPMVSAVRAYFTSVSLGSRQRPWRVTAIVDASRSETWHQASALIGLTTTSAAIPSPRLWQPDTLVEHYLWPLLQQQLSTSCTMSEATEIWDLGAGAGRDVCFLAEQLLHYSDRTSNPAILPTTVVAFDQRYRNEQRNEALHFFARRGVDAVTRCQQIDLQDVAAVLSQIDNVQKRRNVRVVCVYAVRYWNQLLVEQIAQTNCLRSGTLFAISQFGKSHVGAAWMHQHPKEKHVLERHTLADIFSSPKNCSGWTILHDEVVLDSDHGRTLIQFVAQKA